MAALFRTRFLPAAAALLALAGFAGSAEAGWVTIRNDTNKAIVVQESVCHDGQMRRGKPIRLLPGESIREFRAPGTRKTVEVFDGQNPGKSLGSTTLTARDENQTFSVSTDGRSVTVTALSARRGESPDMAKK